MKRTSSTFNNGTDKSIMTFTIGISNSKMFMKLDEEGINHAMQWIDECEQSLHRFKESCIERLIQPVTPSLH